LTPADEPEKSSARVIDAEVFAVEPTGRAKVPLYQRAETL
jgi:hypothetical protein